MNLLGAPEGLSTDGHSLPLDRQMTSAADIVEQGSTGLVANPIPEGQLREGDPPEESRIEPNGAADRARHLRRCRV